MPFVGSGLALYLPLALLAASVERTTRGTLERLPALFLAALGLALPAVALAGPTNVVAQKLFAGSALLLALTLILARRWALLMGPPRPNMAALALAMGGTLAAAGTMLGASSAQDSLAWKLGALVAWLLHVLWTITFVARLPGVWPSLRGLHPSRRTAAWVAWEQLGERVGLPLVRTPAGLELGTEVLLTCQTAPARVRVQVEVPACAGMLVRRREGDTATLADPIYGMLVHAEGAGVEELLEGRHEDLLPVVHGLGARIEQGLLVWEGGLDELSSVAGELGPGLVEERLSALRALARTLDG